MKVASIYLYGCVCVCGGGGGGGSRGNATTMRYNNLSRTSVFVLRRMPPKPKRQKSGTEQGQRNLFSFFPSASTTASTTTTSTGTSTTATSTATPTTATTASMSATSTATSTTANSTAETARHPAGTSISSASEQEPG